CFGNTCRCQDEISVPPQCGPWTDLCGLPDPGRQCQAGYSCNSGSCVCVPNQDCAGKCGSQADQCGNPYDCGSCGPVCGNGWCEAGEDCSTCAYDCGSCGPVCGDGWCDWGEDCSTCSYDCGGCGGGPTGCSSDSDCMWGYCYAGECMYF